METMRMRREDPLEYVDGQDEEDNSRFVNFLRNLSKEPGYQLLPTDKITQLVKKIEADPFLDEADIAYEVEALVIRRLNLFSSAQRKNIENMWGEIYASKKISLNLAALADMPEEMDELDADEPEMELEV